MSLAEKIEKYNEQNHNYSFEGNSGIKKLTALVKVLGYGDYFEDPLTSFLADNSDAIYAVIEWIGTQRNPEWEENLDAVLIPDEEDEDPDSDEDE